VLEQKTTWDAAVEENPELLSVDYVQTGLAQDSGI